MSKLNPAKLKTLLHGLEEAAKVMSELKDLVNALHSDSEAGQNSILNEIKTGIEHLATKLHLNHPKKEAADAPTTPETH
jgi:hypothetical protein